MPLDVFHRQIQTLAQLARAIQDGNAGMVQGSGGARLAQKAFAMVSSALASERITLTATVRSKRESRARYTSPMPPAPKGETISYGPSFVPDIKPMDCRII
jgi:hypothetical protein